MNLRVKLALSMMGIVLLALTVAAIGAQSSAARVAERGIDEYLLSTVEEDRQGAPRRTTIIRQDGDIADRESRTAIVVAQWIDTSGRLIESSRVLLPIDQADLRIAATADSSRYDVVRFRTITINGARFRLITANINAEETLIRARNMDDIDENFQRLLRQVGLFGLLGAVVAGIAGWFLARRIIKPVEALTTASEHVAETQDLTEHIEVHQNDEVGRLAASFNTMLTALGTSREQQRRLVQDANHELRTPLTSVRTNIELLQRRPDMPAEDKERLLGDVGSELDQLTRLVEELVESATHVSVHEERSNVDFAALVEDVVERVRRQSGRLIVLESTHPTTLSARPEMIERAVVNLLNNAVKFSPPSTPIDVRLDRATLEVSDMGPGIAPEDRPYVFDRFYRSDKARNAPGSGLGLSIVRQVVENHGGKVWATSSKHDGARVGFEVDAAVIPQPQQVG